MPEYVVMPNSHEEISSIIRLLSNHKIPYVVRGNGASPAMAWCSSEGVVMDLNRMKNIDFDEKNWSVKWGRALHHLLFNRKPESAATRVHTAEPAALVCANVMTSGLLSTFSTTYGISADNFIDAEFIGRDGSFFSLSDRTAPNLFSFNKALSEHEAFAICVSVSMKLHPVTDDEEGILVPF